MQRVAIIGLGLIGGSIGLALKRWSQANGKSGGQALEIVICLLPAVCCFPPIDRFWN